MDANIQRNREKGCYPTMFTGMRKQHRIIPAISNLVRSGDLQAGLKHMHRLKLPAPSIEVSMRPFRSMLAPRENYSG